jgi:predicted PurR-regulated permease PerM
MADEADTPHFEAPRRAAPVVVPRWVQLVMLPLGVLALYALAQAAGVVLLLFVVAAVVALILNPLVKLLQRARLPRTLAVIAVYAVFFTALPVTGFLLSSPVSDQATSFANDVPGLVDGASRSLDDLQRFLHQKGIQVQIKGQSESALASLQKQVVAGSGQIVAITGELLRTLVELSFYVILVIVLSIYMLIYAPEIGRLVRKVMPPGDGTPQDDFPTRVQHAVFGYVLGQLLFSLTMGASAGVALWIFGLLRIFPDGRTYAFAFGLFFGLMELVPYVGPLLGALPPIVVALAQDPLMAVWVALLFLALQQLEGPRRGAELRALAAPEPAARDLRAAAGRREPGGGRRAHRAADRGDPARDRRVPQGAPRLRALELRPADPHRHAGRSSRPRRAGTRSRSRSPARAAARARPGVREPARARTRAAIGAGARGADAPARTRLTPAQASRCRSSTQRTACGSVSTSGRSRFTTTGSCPLRTSTHDSGASGSALISWCGTYGGTKMKSPGPASATYSSRSPQRIRARPPTT